MKLFSKIAKNTFLNFIIYILFPTSIASLSLIVVVMFFNHSYKNMLKENYITFFSSLYNSNEVVLENISHPIFSLSDNYEFMQIASGRTNNADFITKTQEKIKSIETSNSFIDSISVFDRTKTKSVITSTEIISMDTYFSDKYIYNDYDFYYWLNYRFPTIEKRYLAPTEVYCADNNTRKTILPLVFSKIGNTHISNIVIVNIDLKNFISTQHQNELLEGTVLGMINKQSETLYLSDDSFDTNMENSFYKTACYVPNIAFDSYIGNEKYFITAYSPQKTILGYTYVAFIPYKSIQLKTKPVISVFAFILILTMLIILPVSYISASKLYNPIKKLTSLLQVEPEINIIEQLHVSIANLIEITKKAEEYSLNNTLPFVQEHFIINLLNSPEDIEPPTLNDMREKNLINFENDYFCTVITNITLSETFYATFSATEYDSIISGLLNVVHFHFNERFNTYILPSKTYTMYILLNLSENDTKEKIYDVIEDINNLLEYDKSYISLNYSIGDIQQDLKGLLISHKKALHSIDYKNSYGLVDLEPMKTEKISAYLFTPHEETLFTDYLITGKIESANLLISKIINKNFQSKVSDSSVMQLYAQLISIIFKVMRMKKIEYDPDDKGDFALITNAISFSILNAHNYVDNLLEQLSISTQTGNIKVDINAVIDYIAENYQNELFLESLAERFKTTPKYLSKLIKTHLGETFLSYLSALRINKAKELLLDSNKNINEIYKEVGFNNRNSFTSTFKKLVGFTPSEYKRLHTHNTLNINQ